MKDYPEDLWRLSNKQIVTDFDAEDGQEAQADSIGQDSTAKVVVTDPKKREFYTQDLPLTEDMLKLSNATIEEAYYNMGFIYKSGLKDNFKSIETFEKMLERFPEAENKLQVYYQLYKNYEEVPDITKSEYYKNLIVKEYPDSDYAKIIIDPNYNLVLEARRNAAKHLYENTYQAYMNDQFYMVINNYNEAREKYNDNILISKFEFLKALAVGKIQNLDSLATSLEYLVATYPDSEVKPLATDILSRLQKDDQGLMVLTDKPTDVKPGDKKETQDLTGSPYLVDSSAVHFFIYFVNSSSININALKIRISDFNSKYYSTEQLKINSIVFLDEIQMVTVGNFENVEKVMGYYESIGRNQYISSQLEGSTYETMVISVDNYPILYREKNIADYKAFFENKYLQQ